MATNQVTVSIARCARCGQNHKNLIFKRFESPPDEWTHWALCPKTGEPILMCVVGGIERHEKR